MNITLQPGKLAGFVSAPSSKSMAHRMLICAAFAADETHLRCPQTSRDIAATVDCLNVLGADIRPTADGYRIRPITEIPESATLHCGESGSTLRFLLPIVGALGINATFCLEGRLPQRPLSPLWEEMERMGCALSCPTADTVQCKGKLRPGAYQIDGSISSQFVSGLLFALPLIQGETALQITGKAESLPYIEMTRRVMECFRKEQPQQITVEGDWSNAAFFLAANALGSHIAVANLDDTSAQGDRTICEILPFLRYHATIGAADIPDLIPILSVVAAANRGAVFEDIARLRFKESDRVASIIAMLEALGGKAEATENTLTVYGTGLTGGTVDSFGDHRIAMSAAIAATVCTKPVTVLGADCVRKSYPKFWDDYAHLGGSYEKYLR